MEMDPSDPSKIHVLLAEDNAVNRLLIQTQLEKMGHRMSTVANGKDACRAVDGPDAFDVILMDCEMPEMDGFAATRSIRRAEAVRRLHRIPIIAVTANAMKGAHEKCLASGMDDFLAKPVHVNVLSEVVSRWSALGGRSRKIKEDRSGPIDFCSLQPLYELQMETNPGFVGELIGIYLNATPGRLGSLKKALEASDVGTVVREAHSLKSSSANVGALAMSALCGRLEDAMRSPNPSLSEWSAAGLAIDQEFRKLHQELHELLLLEAPTIL